MSDGSIFTTASDTADTFQIVRNIHDKNDGLFAHHFIFSFPPSEKIDAEQAHKVALQLVKQAFPNYESVVAIHNDCKHLHAHIILNAVNTKTGMKYCDNKASLYYLRNLSNEICKRYGLSVLPKLNGKEGIDQATIHTKNSWKKNLLKVLDKAILNCKTRLDFINFVNKNGYECRYTGANITIKKLGEKKGVRVDTLAQQFNNTKYTKKNLEIAMGYWERPDFDRTKRSVARKVERQRQAQNERQKYNGEWAKIEKYIFSQPEKPRIIESEYICTNINVMDLTEQPGADLVREISYFDIPKLYALDCYFSGRKKKDKVVITIKEYNKEKFDLVILRQVDELMLKLRRENLERNARIKATAKENEEKPCYRVITSAQVEKLQNKGLEFAYFLRDDGNFNIVFNKNIEEKINAELKAETIKLSLYSQLTLKR
jgi:hypothetical protein